MQEMTLGTENSTLKKRTKKKQSPHGVCIPERRQANM